MVCTMVVAGLSGGGVPLAAAKDGRGSGGIRDNVYWHCRWFAVLGTFGLAESVGFEPTVPLRAHTISSRAQSSTLATLRGSATGNGAHLAYEARYGGESGIRTHDGVAPIPVFETGAFVRSAISPLSLWEIIAQGGREFEYCRDAACSQPSIGRLFVRIAPEIGEPVGHTHEEAAANDVPEGGPEQVVGSPGDR